MIGGKLVFAVVQKCIADCVASCADILMSDMSYGWRVIFFII